MPNRILRDWTDSEKMDSLSFQAEVLFTRLMMKADDFGSFHANPKLINSFCFPLKNIRETDITRWISELETSGLIALYDADNKRYLNILNFGQRLRAMKKAFPLYVSNSPQIVSNSPPEKEVETETEEEEESARNSPQAVSINKNSFNQFPNEECLSLELPIIKIGAAKELLKITKNMDVDEKKIIEIWHVFKIQNFTGKKFYQSESDVYSHFINWIRIQKFEQTKQETKSNEPSYQDILERNRAKYGAGKNTAASERN